MQNEKLKLLNTKLLSKVLFVSILFLIYIQVHAATPDSCKTPKINPGAIELGFSGSLNVVENISNASISLRCGIVTSLWGDLVGSELEVSYVHIRSLDLIDLQGNFGWQKALKNSPVYPFFAFGAGLRQEWLGSFRQARYPVGINLGLRTLVSHIAVIRFEYKLRRILNDPIANFTEHRIDLGISLLLRNSR